MNYWQSPLIINQRSFPRFIGAPLDGITDSPFRQLVRTFSPHELLYTEMRHVGTIAHDKGAAKALRFAQLERPLNFQIAANGLQFIQPAIERILEAGVDMVDLNVGCPAKNVVSSCSGSALMGNVPKLKEILCALREALGNTTFTIKIRAGFKEKNAVEVAQLAQDCGVDALAIHPRLRSEMFAGQPDYDLAAAVKKAVSIPVIISGNIVNFKVANMVYERTGVDGYLIGRALWARPWKLLEMDQHSKGLEYPVPLPLVVNSALKHLDAMLDYYGPHGLYCFRKHLPFYIKGVSGASALRESLTTATCPLFVRDRLQEMLG